jgi:hypothetical protein
MQASNAVSMNQSQTTTYVKVFLRDSPHHQSGFVSKMIIRINRPYNIVDWIITARQSARVRHAVRVTGQRSQQEATSRASPKSRLTIGQVAHKIVLDPSTKLQAVSTGSDGSLLAQECSSGRERPQRPPSVKHWATSFPHVLYTRAAASRGQVVKSALKEAGLFSMERTDKARETTMTTSPASPWITNRRPAEMAEHHLPV